MKKIYKDYADVKSQIKELQIRADALKEAIEEDMIASGEDKLATSYGNFSMTSRSYWTYSDDYKVDVAKMQKKEQATGKAEQKVTTSLTLKANDTIALSGVEDYLVSEL